MKPILSNRSDTLGLHFHSYFMFQYENMANVISPRFNFFVRKKIPFLLVYILFEDELNVYYFLR